MRRRVPIGAAIVVALLGFPAISGTRTASACRYATPAALGDEASSYPVSLLGRVTTTSSVDGQLAYRIAVDEVIQGGAPAELTVHYGGGDCSDVQPALRERQLYLLLLAPYYLLDEDGGSAGFNGSPFAAFAVDGDHLTSAARLDSPLADAVVAGGLARFRVDVAGYSWGSQPWRALNDASKNIGYEIQVDDSVLGQPVRLTHLVTEWLFFMSQRYSAPPMRFRIMGDRLAPPPGHSSPMIDALAGQWLANGLRLIEARLAPKH